MWAKKATAYWLLSKSIWLIKNSQKCKKVTIINTLFWIWKLSLRDILLAKMPWLIYGLRQHSKPSRFISEGCNFINFPILVKNTGSRDFLGGQWLRLCTPKAGSRGLILDQGTRSYKLKLRAGTDKFKCKYTRSSVPILLGQDTWAQELRLCL